MHYAIHNGVGVGEMPAGAVEITAEQYAEALDRIVAGERIAIVDGTPVYYSGRVYLLDGDSYFAGHADELPAGAELIQTTPAPDLLKPKWNGVAWIEGADPAAIEAAQAQRVLDAKSAAIADIKAEAQRRANAYMSSYPEFETLTWDAQEREARAYLADATADTPTLAPIAQARGLTIINLAGRVVAKSDAFRAAAAALMGQRQALEDAITEAATVEAVQAVVWPEGEPT